ncbi:MAG TPA: phage tail assembly chaperone [Syntrophorhabdaceae bacterium]|nr:phage tail assembly chaperone [Syntrophorhabdaceae bacterium]
MKIYHYDPKTKEYTGESNANPDPLEPGSFLQPPFSARLKPPAIGNNQAAIFQGGTWILVADYRRSTWWKKDGTKYAINDLGISPEPTDTDYDPRPSVYHVWSGTQFILDRESWLNGEIRPRRNGLLNETDTVYCNAERWESMTTEAKQIWKTYKQNLRDLPAAIDYSNQVWPARPV